MNFETPREAVLRAENERLKSEVAYLRKAVDPAGQMMFTPIGAVEEMVVHHFLPEIKLPLVASIHGGLSRYGNYHVLARLGHDRSEPEDLTVQYHAPADMLKAKADYAVNELFPYLHQRFISSLANAIRKPKQEVA